MDTVERLIREALEWLFKRTDFSCAPKRCEKNKDAEEETCTQKN